MSAVPWPVRPSHAMTAGLVVGLPALIAGTVAAGMSPAVAGAACLLAAVGLLLLRRFARDPTGAWCLAIPVVTLLGECGSLGLGGQSGRILWVDVWLAVGIAWLLARGRYAFELPRTRFLEAALPLIAWSALLLPLARDPLTAIAELKEWCVAGVAGAFALTWARDPSRGRRLLASVAFSGAILGVLMAVAAWRDPLGPAAAIVLKRVDLPWGRTNYLAGLLVLVIPLALGFAGSVTGVLRRAGWLAITAVSATGLALATSKGAVLSAAFGCAAAFFGPWARGASRTTRLALIGAAAALILVYVAGPLRQALDYRMQSSALDYSGSERIELYRLAIDLVLSHPLTGIGLNNFSVASHGLHGLDTVPHNFVLGFASELGLPGLVLALAWGAAVIARAVRGVRAAEPASRTLALGVLAAVLGAALHNQFESTLYGEQFKILLVLLLAGGHALAAPGRAPCPAQPVDSAALVRGASRHRHDSPKALPARQAGL